MACSSEHTVTGRSGRFELEGNLVARVTQWAVNSTLATTSEWGDSDSAGYTNRAIGRRDATFTAEGKFDEQEEAYELFKIGTDHLEALLWMNTELFWYFPCCICLDFNLTVDVDTEEVIGWTSNWGADGIFYYPGQGSVVGQTAYPTGRQQPAS